jgi:N-acyl-L-homoserine lactone synthetase
MSFRISSDPSLLAEAYLHRYRVFKEEMGVAGGTGHLEYDAYDHCALHAFLHIDGEFATYARMITDACGDFPSEALHRFPLGDIRNVCVEFSRAFSVRRWRRTDVLSVGFRRALEYCKQHDIRYVLGLSTTAMFNSVRRESLTFYYIGEPMQAYGYNAQPYIIDVRASV